MTWAHGDPGCAHQVVPLPRKKSPAPRELAPRSRASRGADGASSGSRGRPTHRGWDESLTGRGGGCPWASTWPTIPVPSLGQGLGSWRHQSQASLQGADMGTQSLLGPSQVSLRPEAQGRSQLLVWVHGRGCLRLEAGGWQAAEEAEASEGNLSAQGGWAKGRVGPRGQLGTQ